MLHKEDLWFLHDPEHGLYADNAPLEIFFIRLSTAATDDLRTVQSIVVRGY